MSGSIIASHRPVFRQLCSRRSCSRCNPIVILAVSTPITAALQRETRTVPIVFVGITADPISSGFVASLARPGGNLTGVVLFEATVIGKWLAMLKEIAPRLAHAALVFNPKTAPYYDYYLRAGEAAASSLAVEFAPLTIENAAADIERAIQAFARVPNGGLVVLPDSTNGLYFRIAFGEPPVRGRCAAFAPPALAPRAAAPPQRRSASSRRIDVVDRMTSDPRQPGPNTRISNWQRSVSGYRSVSRASSGSAGGTGPLPH